MTKALSGVFYNHKHPLLESRNYCTFMFQEISIKNILDFCSEIHHIFDTRPQQCFVTPAYNRWNSQQTERTFFRRGKRKENIFSL